MKARQAVCDPDFRPLLLNFDSKLLDSNVVCAYGLDPDLRFKYFSPGWFAFASDNGGEPEISKKWQLGSEVLSAIGGPLQSYFAAGYKKCLAEHRPWQHSYECSSDDTYRLFEMICYPLSNGKGLLTIHSRRVERGVKNEHVDLDVGAYVDSQGIYHQCSYCRRFRKVDQPLVWDRISAWVRQPPKDTSHGICETCAAYYLTRIDGGLDFPDSITTE